MDWIILRTQGKNTLRLAQTLTEDGYEAWTPVETRKIVIPSKNVRREAKLPIMPSYVFARSAHLIDLLQLADMKPKPRRSANQPAHADFSVMHFHDRIPAIPDGHLHQLRRIEAKTAPKAKAKLKFQDGVSVRVKTEGGSFAGMSGRVEKSDEGATLVCFDNRLTVKISTCLLETDSVQDGNIMGIAA